jgi:hypothetical protein
MSNPYRDKLLGVGLLRSGRSRPRVRESRAPDGHLMKSTTDELNNTTIEHAVPGDRVDVRVCPQTVQVKLSGSAGEGGE